MRTLVLPIALLLTTVAVAQDQPTLQQRAASAAASADWSTAQRLYAQLTAEQADDPAAWYQLGLSTLNAGLPSQGALDAFARAAELGFAPGPVQYGIARAHALNGNADGVLAALGTLAAAGPSRGVLVRLQSENAFDFLREDARFAELLQQLTPCATAQYRQFDFWLGQWRVVSPTDQPLGRNTVAAILDGCMLTESWESGQGGKGFSINYYDSTTDSWTQTYRDNTGTISNWPDLRGGLRDGAMVLENRDDPQNHTRWTWTRISDDRVRQMAESSTDGGQTWQVVWDSYYLREQ